MKITDDWIDKRCEKLEVSARLAARHRYFVGQLWNPYKPHSPNPEVQILSFAYDKEMMALLHERTHICPSCGQPTAGDIDY